MRAFLLAAFVATLSASAAFAQGGNDFPRDEVSLRALDNQQLRIVRRAGAQCWHSGDTGFVNPQSPRARACIISLTESAIANSEDPALQAYHHALPFNARYDEYRANYYWQRFVQS
jgi:hypothetical protein